MNEGEPALGQAPMEGRRGARASEEVNVSSPRYSLLCLGPAHAGVRGKESERVNKCCSLKLVLDSGTAGLVCGCRCVEAVLPETVLGIEGGVAGWAGMHAE